MDFLVVGLGLGALAILSGITMLTLVVWRSEQAARRAARADDRHYQAAVAASQIAAGQALIAAGAAILLATVGAIAGSLDDRTGSLLVATTATVAAIGLIVRDVLYRSRHPLLRRSRARPLAASPPQTAPFAPAPFAAAPRGDARGSMPLVAEAEVMAATGPDFEPEQARDAPIEVDTARAAGEDDHSRERAVLAPMPDVDLSIEAPYSFMQDDDPASGERTVPYSFMGPNGGADEPAAGGPGVDGDVEGDAEAVSVDTEAPHDSPASDDAPPTRPFLRLVGKERARTP